MERRVAVVVEDDADIRELLAEVLEQSGFTVHQAETGAAGVAAVREHEPVVVTVDLGLPDFDGYEVTRRVRQFSDAYVVMLTARTEEIDTLLGLEAGSDDYVTKPFRPRELRARIEAMLRRPRTGAAGSTPAGGVPQPHSAHSSAHPSGHPPAHPSALPSAPLEPTGSAAATPALPPTESQEAHFAATASTWSGPGAVHSAGSAPPSSPRGSGLSPSWAPVHGSAAPAPQAPSAAPAPHMDPAARAQLTLDGLALYPYLHRVEANGREVALTPTEFQLLATMLRSGQVVRSKAELARTVRGDDADGGTFVSKADERTVEVHVGNLRRKLADDPNAPRWIQTVRGVGYRMAGRPVAIS